MKLHGKIIAITGASSGIGAELARQAARKGAIPVLLARTEGKLKQLQQQIQTELNVTCHVYVLDVSKEDMVTAVFSQIERDLGMVDILINNAGFGIFKAFESASMEEVKEMFQVNVFGLVACTKAVLPGMTKRNSGHTVNIASMAGKIATPKSSAYAATKHAVLGFTNSLRMELAQTGVRVTAVNPGPIETNFFEIADQSGTYVNSVKSYMLQADYVAKKIIQAIEENKREVNLPRWMNAGSVFFALFPKLFERFAGKTLSKK